MEFENYQYIKLDLPIEKIAKIKVIDDRNINNYKTIEDIKIEIENPNIFIYKVNFNKEPNYYNIFPTVKILITNERGLWYELWNKIPDYIEHIIVNNRIYINNKNEFDFIEFTYDLEETIDKFIDEGKINDYNIFGETLLYHACRINIIKAANKLIDLMNEDAINKTNIQGLSALYWVCYTQIIRIDYDYITKKDIYFIQKFIRKNKLEKINIDILNEINIELIEKSDEDAKYWIFYYGLRSLMKEIVEYFEENEIIFI